MSKVIGSKKLPVSSRTLHGREEFSVFVCIVKSCKGNLVFLDAEIPKFLCTSHRWVQRRHYRNCRGFANYPNWYFRAQLWRRPVSIVFFSAQMRCGFQSVVFLKSAIWGVVFLVFYSHPKNFGPAGLISGYPWHCVFHHSLRLMAFPRLVFGLLGLTVSKL